MSKLNLLKKRSSALKILKNHENHENYRCVPQIASPEERKIKKAYGASEARITESEHLA